MEEKRGSRARGGETEAQRLKSIERFSRTFLARSAVVPLIGVDPRREPGYDRLE
jgi:hypothetical protein